MSPAQPTLTTAASGSVGVGGLVYDTATLTGGVNPTGTVTFQLYWPGDTACTHTPVFTSTNQVTAGSATSSSFAPRVAGTYRWTASYSGGAANAAVAGACNDPGESVSVSKASPTLATRASGSTPVGGQVSDTATLSGRFNGVHVPCEIFLPPGSACADSAPPPPSVAFTLYGPDDAGCVGAPVYTSIKPLGANEVASSGPFTPTAPGTYRWVASYAGDDANNLVRGACNAPGESVVVTGQPGQPSSGTSKPVLMALSISPARFRAAQGGPSIAALVGSMVSYRLAAAASVTFRVEGALTGRRVLGRCLKPTRSNRRASKCVRYVTLAGSFTHQGRAGLNKFKFTGRLRGHKLASGSYRLRGEATDATGNKSPVARIGFRIVVR